MATKEKEGDAPHLYEMWGGGDPGDKPLLPDPVEPVVSRCWSDHPHCQVCDEGILYRISNNDKAMVCRECAMKEYTKLLEGAVCTVLVGHTALSLPETFLYLESVIMSKDELRFPKDCKAPSQRLLYAVVLKLMREGNRLPLLRGDVTTFFFQTERFELREGEAKDFLNDLLLLTT